MGPVAYLEEQAMPSRAAELSLRIRSVRRKALADGLDRWALSLMWLRTCQEAMGWRD